MSEQTPIRARPDTAVAVLPRPARKRRIEPARLVPSGRATAITLAIVALAIGAYLIARETSLFAVETIDVCGAQPDVAGQVRAALAEVKGSSLVTLDGAQVERRLEALPVVAAAHYDRDFPHTLRVFVQPERAVAVVRKGPDSWLVSARARVISSLRLGEESTLPRIWIPGKLSISAGVTLGGDPARAVAAAAPLVRSLLKGRVAVVRATPHQLILRLRSGMELRLGDGQNLPLKLAIGARIAASAPHLHGYVDLTVPDRPVSNLNAQPGGLG